MFVCSVDGGILEEREGFVASGPVAFFRMPPSSPPGLGYIRHKRKPIELTVISFSLDPEVPTWSIFSPLLRVFLCLIYIMSRI